MADVIRTGPLPENNGPARNNNNIEKDDSMSHMQGTLFKKAIRDLKQARTATAVNKQLNFTVKNKQHTTNYIYVVCCVGRVEIQIEI